MTRAAGIILSTTLGLAFAATPLSAPLRAEALEARGKQIYLEGRDPEGGEILASVGRSDISLPAIMLPCANCHGGDGLGRAEGGMRPPNITWAELTKPYGHRHPGGRSHSAFDAAAVGRAVTGGVDPAGNPLDPAMPRYDMSESGVQALVAYLQRLSADLDPGLTATTIRVAMEAPEAGPMAPVGRAATATTTAYFKDVNETGGIFGRKIELTVLDRAPDAGLTVANAQRLTERREVFAMVSIFGTGGLERLPVPGRNGMPQVGAFNLSPDGETPQGGSTFLLLSGLSEQARALIGFAAGELGLAAPRIAVVLPDGSGSRLAGAIEQETRQRGWPSPTVVHFSGGQPIDRQVNELKQSEIEAVLYFGPAGGLTPFATGAAEAGWLPYFLLSGLNAGRAAFDVPPVFGDKLFLAYPSVPSDHKSLTSFEFEDLHRRHGISPQYPVVRAMAYAAAKVLVEGLRRSGKALSRARFIAALEGLTDFETGVTPPISFGPNRRTGVLGAYILGVDLKNGRYRPGTVWAPL